MDDALHHARIAACRHRFKKSMRDHFTVVSEMRGLDMAARAIYKRRQLGKDTFDRRISFEDRAQETTMPAAQVDQCVVARKIVFPHNGGNLVEQFWPDSATHFRPEIPSIATRSSISRNETYVLEWTHNVSEETILQFLRCVNRTSRQVADIMATWEVRRGWNNGHEPDQSMYTKRIVEEALWLKPSLWQRAGLVFRAPSITSGWSRIRRTHRDSRDRNYRQGVCLKTTRGKGRTRVSDARYFNKASQ
jgi:hypothetical protein